MRNWLVVERVYDITVSVGWAKRGEDLNESHDKQAANLNK